MKTENLDTLVSYENQRAFGQYLAAIEADVRDEDGVLLDQNGEPLLEALERDLLTFKEQIADVLGDLHAC